jgi:hypothetical protein
VDSIPPFLRPVYEHDSALYDVIMHGMEISHSDAGDVPKKYRLLFSLIADGMMNHPTGVVAMDRAARAAGASDAEINEAMRVIYISGGMVALLNSIGAYEE